MKNTSILMLLRRIILEVFFQSFGKLQAGENASSRLSS